MPLSKEKNPKMKMESLSPHPPPLTTAGHPAVDLKQTVYLTGGLFSHAKNILTLYYNLVTAKV